MTDISRLAVRDRIIQTVSGRLDVVARGMCSDPADEEIARTSLAALLATLQARRPLSSDALGTLADYGSTLTTRAISLDDVDRKAQRLTRKLGREMAQAVVAGTLTAGAVEELGEMTADLFQAAERGRRAIAAGHAKGVDETGHPAPESARKGRLLRAGDTHSLVIAVPIGSGHAEECQVTLLERVGQSVAGPLMDIPIPHAVVMVRDAPIDRTQRGWLTELSRQMNAGLVVGAAASTEAAVDAEYTEMREMLDVLLPLLARTRVLFDDELLLVRLILSVPPEERLRFVRGVAGPVLRQGRRTAEPLWSTLGASRGQDSRKGVASALRRSTRTVETHRKRIRELTRFDLAVPKQRAALLLAWLVHTLDNLPSPGSVEWRARPA